MFSVGPRLKIAVGGRVGGGEGGRVGGGGGGVSTETATWCNWSELISHSSHDFLHTISRNS